MNKPAITEVIGRRINLRQVGREFVGLCPFHDDRHPSLSVNPEKGVFLCRACQECGDVIDFIRKVENLSFKKALAYLAIDCATTIRQPHNNSRSRRAAELLARWFNEQHVKIGAMLRQLSRQIVIAEEADAMTLLERLSIEFSLLEIFFDDLQRPQFAEEFLELKDAIERITATAPDELLSDFPSLTHNYRLYLAEVVAC